MNKYGIGFAFLTTFLWGVTPVFEKLGLQKANPVLGVTVRSVAIAVIMLVVFLASGQAKELVSADKHSLLFLILGGIIAGLLGQLTYFTALKYAPSTLVVPIAGSYPLVAMIMSLIFLGEKFTLQKGIGTALVILGISFLR